MSLDRRVLPKLLLFSGYFAYPLLLLTTLAGCDRPGTTATLGALPAANTETVPLPPLSRDGAFTDVTLAAGIAAQHRLPTPELDNIVDSLGGGAALSDLDGDDWLDLIVLGGPPSPRGGKYPEEHGGIRVYRNLRNGRFQDITQASGIPADGTALAVAVADIEGDGDRDVYLVDWGPNRLYRNRGDGTFEDVTRRAGVADPGMGVGAVFFDMDRDGDLDLYVANYLEFDPRQTAYFAPEGFPGPLNYPAQSDVLYANRGDGTFEDVSEVSGVARLEARGMSLAIADFDDDGDTDVFVANDATENFLLLNDGQGRFTDRAVLAGVAMGENGEQTAAMAADVGDVDRDGRADLVVSDIAYGALYRNLQPGLFVDVAMSAGLGPLCAQYTSWGQNLLDYDNDGDLDLFVANGGLHHLVGWEDLLLANDGRGFFEDASDHGGAYFLDRRVGRSSVTGDYDNDGDIDLFITNLQGRHYLLRNDSPGEAAWVTFELVGKGGTEPFGARVEVAAGGSVWTGEYRPASTYLGQGDSRLHFGLGPSIEKLDRVVITWPDGERQQLADLAVRQIHKLEEGAG